jgi:DNA repair protein RadC
VVTIEQQLSNLVAYLMREMGVREIEIPSAILIEGNHRVIAQRQFIGTESVEQVKIRTGE